LAELSFTLYTDVYGFFNMLGHLLRFISYLVILLGIIKTSITEPLRTLYGRLERELQRYQKLSVIDSLTGVYNRNFFEERIRDMVSRLLKEGVPIVIAMADIDNFKEINDKCSHVVGDRVLKRVGETLRSSLRSGDIVVRFGGDEFLIFLVNCNESLTSKILERLKESVSRLSFEFGFLVSLSIGYTEAPKEEATIEKLIEIADKKMYEEKKRRGHKGPLFKTDHTS